MNNPSGLKRTIWALLVCTFSLPVGAIAQSAEPSRASVKQIFSEPMMEWLGKQIRTFIVEFPPGGESVPHTHPRPILAYVLRGSWTMKMEGMEEHTYGLGEVVYEHSNHKHLVSRNASATEPLQLLVHYLSEPGAPVSVPIVTMDRK